MCVAGVFAVEPCAGSKTTRATARHAGNTASPGTPGTVCQVPAAGPLGSSSMCVCRGGARGWPHAPAERVDPAEPVACWHWLQLPDWSFSADVGCVSASFASPSVVHTEMPQSWPASLMTRTIELCFLGRMLVGVSWQKLLSQACPPRCTRYSMTLAMKSFFQPESAARARATGVASRKSGGGSSAAWSGGDAAKRADLPTYAAW